MRNYYYPKNRLYFHVRFILLFIGSFLFLSLQAQVYYVKPGASGSGASWAAAGDLQTIINTAAAGGQVWVKAGTYYPLAYPSGSTGGSSNRDFAFTLKTGVAVYGGFAGTETLLSQRDPVANVTILSGDVGTTGTYTDDCYHVVISVSNTNTAVLDGFNIKFGYANGAGSITYGGQTVNQNFGAGIFCYNASPAIANCVFSNNLAATGGGIYNRNSGTPPVFTNCTFTSNTASSASDGGGAVYNYSSTAVTFNTCTFTSNKATGQDGGVAFGNSSSIFIFSNCTMTSNTAAANGGAIYCNNSSSLTITNSSLTSNIAAQSGGAIVTMSSSTTAVSNTSFDNNTANSATLGGGAIYSYSTNGSTADNCTFTGNHANTYGGAFYGNSGSGGLIMSDCVFNSNSATYGGGMANTGGSAPTVNNCKFSNGSATYGAGVYNINGSPNFSLDSFFNNTSTATSGMGGGGMVNDAGANTNISHCWFRGNVTNGADGAGQYDNGSAAPTDTSCVFEANIAGGAVSNGGGLYHGGAGNAKVENCVFVDNQCKTNGGAYYNNASNSTIENCTFYNNKATAGAGIYDPGGGNTKYYANMMWNNNPDGFGLGAGATGGFKVKYNNFQEAYTGGGSVTANTFLTPSFYNAGSYVGSDGKWATGDDGLHLATGSVGTAAVPVALGITMPDDITVGPRPYTAPNANEGAYESPGFAVLPANLVSFVAVPTASNAVAVQWHVDAATQAVVYEVQKSANGTVFSTIGAMEAVSVQSFYAYTDLQAGEGTLYYRLKLTNNDKSIAYSPIAMIRNAVCKTQLALRPSIIHTGTASLFIGSAAANTCMLLTVTDASGRVQLRKSIVVAQGDNNILLDMGRLGKGVYFLRVVDAGGFQKVLPFEKQ